MRTLRKSVSDFALTPLAAALGLVLLPQAAHAEAVVVNDSSDTSSFNDTEFTPARTTLRGAIDHFNQLDVNGAPFCTGSDTITFDTTIFGTDSPFVTQPSSQFPSIDCAGLVIDGGGSSSDVGRARVVIDGSQGNFPYGMYFGFQTFETLSPHAKINGLEMRNFHLSGSNPNDPKYSQSHAVGAASDSMDVTNSIFDHNDVGIAGAASVTSNRLYANATGLYVEYGGQAMGNNVIHDNTTAGIWLATGSSGISIVHNFIGIDDGSRPDLEPGGNDLGIYMNSGFGVLVQSNWVSNNGEGICIANDEVSQILSNNIGTDLSVTSPAPNTFGVDIGFCGPNGSVPLGQFSYGTTIQNNVVVSSDDAIDADSTSSVDIVGNYIGTDRTAAIDMSGSFGIYVSCSDSPQVASNKITTSDGTGIEFDAVSGGGRAGVLEIAGNRIGVKGGSGVAPLGSSSYGVFLGFGTCGTPGSLGVKRASTKDGISGVPSDATNQVTVDNNTIANTADSGMVLDGAYNTTITNNTITNTSNFGIAMADCCTGPGAGNVWLNNTIYNTRNKAVDLNFGTASLPNDSMDADGFPVPNDGQNWPDAGPTFGSVTQSGGQTTIAYTLDTESLVGYQIDFFANSTTTTVPGGDLHLGNQTLVGAGGPTSGTFTYNGLVDSISMTATKMSGTQTIETSEYSPVFALAALPNVSITPDDVSFGNVALNTTSVTRQVIIGSTGTADATLGAMHSPATGACDGGSICYGGAFTCTTTCGPTLAHGTTCEVDVTYHPTVLGSDTQTIEFCPTGLPVQQINLSGTGVTPPPVVFAPAAFDFGTQLAGTKSAPEMFELANPGSTVVPIGPLSVTGPFAIVDSNCGASVPPLLSCQVDVVFAPTQPGAASGVLSVAAGSIPSSLALKVHLAKGHGHSKLLTAGGTSATVDLSGTGVITPVLSLPSAIQFGSYTAGTPPVSQTVTLTNSGNGVLSLLSITLTSPFTLANGCPQNLQPGESCTLVIGFGASALGPYDGTLTVMSNAAGGSRAIPVTAQTVATAAPRLRITPAQIGFGDRLLGSSSASQRVTIENIGNADAALSTSMSTVDFLVSTTTCGPVLSPASTCFADVVFRPAGFGTRPGSLVVNSNADDSPQSVSLTGSGCRPFNASSRGRHSGNSCSP